MWDLETPPTLGTLPSAESEAESFLSSYHRKKKRNEKKRQFLFGIQAACIIAQLIFLLMYHQSTRKNTSETYYTAKATMDLPSITFKSGSSSLYSRDNYLQSNENHRVLTDIVDEKISSVVAASAANNDNKSNYTRSNEKTSNVTLEFLAEQIRMMQQMQNWSLKEKEGEIKDLRSKVEIQQKELLQKEVEIALLKQNLSEKYTVATSILSTTKNNDHSDTVESSIDKTGTALDENGSLGYVPPTIDLNYSLRNKNYTDMVFPNSLLHLNESCHGIFPENAEGVGGYKVLRKIKITNSSTKTRNNDRRKVRILCMVYTHSNNHENLNAILNTWAPRCDGFFAASNITDQNSHSVNLLHNGPESYQNMWQKVRSMWKYAYLHYRHEYDYFHICGDDTYVMVDNLRTYLEGDVIAGILNGTKRPIYSKMQERVFYYGLEEKQVKDKYMKALPIWKGDVQAYHQTSISNMDENERKDDKFMILNYTNIPERPLVIGMAQDRNANIKWKGNAAMYQTYPAGGCGYTFNRAALTLFVEECVPKFLPTREDSREDVLVGGCMAEHGIHTIDTRDEKGRYLYLPMNAQEHYEFNGKGGTWLANLLEAKHRISALSGLESISPNAVAIHVKKARRMTYKDVSIIGEHGNWTKQEIKEYWLWRNSSVTISKLIHRYHALLHDLC